MGREVKGRKIECNLSNGRSQSYKVIELLLSAGQWVVVKLQGDQSASQVFHGTLWPMDWELAGPLQESSGPSGPKTPLSARESVPEKRGVPGSVWGSAPGILWTFGHTPIFGDTLSDTPMGTSGLKGPKTPVGGRRVLNPWISGPLRDSWVSLRAQILKNFKILKFSSAPPTKPLFFVGNSGGQDWKFQARLKFSSEIENFKRSWNFSRFGPLGFVKISISLQRAANAGSDPSWLNLAFLGRPDLPSPDVPQTL